MSTKKEIWRLLEPGVDVWQDGDWIRDIKDGWNPVKGSLVNGRMVGSWDGRRRMTLPEPQGWISVKERMPTKEDGNAQGFVLWLCSLGDLTPVHGKVSWMDNTKTHWMPIPDYPKPVNPDEEAWEEWSKKNLMRNYSVGNAEADAALKEGFMAGRKSVMTEKEDSHG